MRVPLPEAQRTLIWIAETAYGRVRVWKLVEDTDQSRARLSLT